MPHNSHNSQNAGGGAVGLSNGVLSTNGGTGIGTTTTAGSSSPSDDLGSTDEVKVFKDEGEQDEEISSQNLLEEKSSLIDLTESEVNAPSCLVHLMLSKSIVQLNNSRIFDAIFFFSGQKTTIETGARICFW